jgi:hypothetical protein
MDSERNRLVVALGSPLGSAPTGARGVIVLAALLAFGTFGFFGVLGCRYDEPPAPQGNTGPGTTVARIVVQSGPAVITVGDSAFYSAKAFDNANNELPVTLSWATSDGRVLAINPATGRGKGVGAGEARVWAGAGSARSNQWLTRVQPGPAFP